MNKYQILAENKIVTTGNESKYQKKYLNRKRLSRNLFPNSEKILSIPELRLYGINKDTRK